MRVVCRAETCGTKLTSNSIRSHSSEDDAGDLLAAKATFLRLLSELTTRKMLLEGVFGTVLIFGVTGSGVKGACCFWGVTFTICGDW